MYLNKETLHQYTMFMSIFRENINLDSRYIHHFYLNTLHKPPRYLSSIHNLQIPKIFQEKLLVTKTIPIWCPCWYQQGHQQRRI